MATPKLGKPIGLERFTIFPILTNDETGTTYGPAIKVGRAVTASLTPQTVEATLDSEDSVEEDISMVSSWNLDFEASQLNEEARAKLFGHEIDEAGGIVYNKSDQSAEVAVAWRSRTTAKGTDGEDQYIYYVLYRGRFSEQPENFETTRRDSITMQTASGVAGRFYARADGEVMYRLRQDNNELFDPALVADWFDAPVEKKVAAGG